MNDVTASSVGSYKWPMAIRANRPPAGPSLLQQGCPGLMRPARVPQKIGLKNPEIFPQNLPGDARVTAVRTVK